ncbi:MAG: DUF4870 domain-containing protein [bacterium]|nr:DUF4870 domain-containing protein [bacterium]
MPEVIKKSTTGLPTNTAAALTYILGWVTGLIFILVEKEDRFVRFHAMQSLIVFGALTLISMIPIIGWILTPVIAIIGFILWLFLIYKAYQGEKYELPYVGSFVRKQLNKS